MCKFCFRTLYFYFSYKYPPKDFKEIEKLTIGNLPNGTPCVMKFDFGVVYGTVQGKKCTFLFLEYFDLSDCHLFVFLPGSKVG